MLRVAVVGVGHMGRLHARNLASRDDCRLGFVLDIDPRRTARAAAEFAAEPARSLAEVAAGSDAAVVAVPTSAHHAVAGELLERGIHVLVEKPIAATVDEADALIASAERARRVLATGHVERFNPIFEATRGEIQGPVFVEAHRLAPFVPRSLDIDVILDLMIHDLDLLLAVHPGPIERVDASGAAVVTAREDIANARIAFADGAVANVTASRVSRERMRRIRFFSTRSYHSLDLFGRRAETVRLVGDPRPWLARGEMPPVAELIRQESIGPFSGTNPLADELADFVRAATTGAPPRVDGRAARRALDLALTIRARVADHLRRMQRSGG
jgi:predicted dehydrogenase